MDLLKEALKACQRDKASENLRVNLKKKQINKNFLKRWQEWDQCLR